MHLSVLLHEFNWSEEEKQVLEEPLANHCAYFTIGSYIKQKTSTHQN